MGHDLSNAETPKAPRGSLVDTLPLSEWHHNNIQRNMFKAVHGWLFMVSNSFIYSGGSFQSTKICLVYFSGVFCLPQAEVFKGTDACCVPVLNPSEAVGVLSCWVVEYATNFHGWISWILFCKAVHEHNRLRRSFLAQVFKAKMLRFLIPMYPNFLAFWHLHRTLILLPFWQMPATRFWTHSWSSAYLVHTLFSALQYLGEGRVMKNVLKDVFQHVLNKYPHVFFSIKRIEPPRRVTQGDDWRMIALSFHPTFGRSLPKARRGFMNRHLRQSYRARLVMRQCLRVRFMIKVCEKM